MGYGGLNRGVLMALKELVCKSVVRRCGRAVRIVLNDRLAKTWRFAESDGAWNNGFVYQIAVMFLHVFVHLTIEACAGVVHGDDDTGEGETRVRSRVADMFDDPRDLAETFQGIVFALQWDDEFIGGGKGVGHENAEGRGAIHDREIPWGINRKIVQNGAQTGEMIFEAGNFDLGPGQIHVGMNEKHVFEAGMPDGIGNGRLADESVIEAFIVILGEADRSGGVALGIEIHEEHATALAGEAGCEVDGGGGFTHTTFLIGDGDDLHEVLWREEKTVTTVKRQREKQTAGTAV